MIQWLLNFSLKNRLGLCLASAFWLVLCGWAYVALPVSLLPDLNFPTLSVVIEYPGVTAEELERQATLPVESALTGVYDVVRVRSETVANLALVTVQLNWGVDLESARQQVMQKITSVQNDLPQGARLELESLGNTLGQVQGFSLTGGGTLEEIHDFAEYRLRPLLLQQPGVYDVLVFGGLMREYGVFVKPAQLQKFDLTLTDLKEALAKNNVSSVGGMLDLGAQTFAVVARTRLTDERSIGETIVAVKNGTPVRIEDVASVRPASLPYRGAAEQGGKAGVVLEIVKQPRADTVAVTRRVDAFMAGSTALLPSGMNVNKYFDQSELVLDAVHGVEKAVLFGALLVGVILFIFLGSWRASLVAFASIPTSLLSALIVMKGLHMSLNIMTLSAMALATGMVIDDAIVVIENVYRHRALHPNLSMREVFIEATAEVAGPVASSTIATVAIFIPLVFLTGLAGRLFSPVGVVVAVVMTASLVFALTLIPSLGATLLSRAPVATPWRRLPAAFTRSLANAFRFERTVILLALLGCAASVFLLSRLNQEFLPLLDEGSVLMNLDAPPSSSLDETLRVTRLAAAHILHDPEVESVVSKTGHAPGMQDTDTTSHSDVYARLVPKAHRKSTIEALMESFRKKTDEFPGVLIDFTMPLQDKLNDAVAGVKSAVGVKLYGDDLGILQKLSDALSTKMKGIPGVVDLRPGSVAATPAVEIDLIPEAARKFGVSRADLDAAVEATSYGLEATKIRRVQKEIPVMIRIEGLDEQSPSLHLDALKQLPIRTADGAFIPLSQVAIARIADVPARIEHEHAVRVIRVSCNIEGQKSQTVVRQIRSALQGIQFPAGYSWEIVGSNAAESETAGSLAAIGVLGLAAVAALLWIEFSSMRKMLLVLLTIPLATIGASVALWATQQSLNVSSLIGLVMLVGIVLRNGIVLIDYIEIAERQGMSVKEAAIEGARVRLRPILMTALSEILGLFPLAIGAGSGAALERPLAIAVIGGLVTSTVLTLYVLPIGYRIFFEKTST